MKRTLLLLFLALSLLFSSCSTARRETDVSTEADFPASIPLTAEESLPTFEGEPFAILNENKPYFSLSEFGRDPFEEYGKEDALGRCGSTRALIGRELMPTEDRGSIGQVKPTGWHTVKYDFVDGKYLYNRCHLIGFQLTGENANVRNLITGTRYLNVEGMLPFENMVADLIKETDLHVAYRVTPVFLGDELVARGVVMEAMSLEDEGESIEFCVFCFNVQPGVKIDYATGESEESDEVKEPQDTTLYVLNTNTKRIHLPHCSSVGSISDKNRKESTLSLPLLKAQGYTPCGICLK
ncbi:MAG: DNA/RNA non-specific endonuclease [Clostridia bacterium]|nr:DNA/RNA non-specific endonuclease [Clostridia bacterium]